MPSNGGNEVAPEWVAPLVRAFIDGWDQQNNDNSGNYEPARHVGMCLLNAMHCVYGVVDPEAAREL